jgi:hypothetical protein
MIINKYKFYESINVFNYAIEDKKTFTDDDEKASFIFHLLDFEAQRRFDFILNHLDM